EKFVTPLPRLFPCQTRSKSMRPDCRLDIFLARLRCVRTNGSSNAPDVDGKSARRCSSDNFVLRRNCCKATKWKNRACSKTESSAHVCRDDPKSLLTIFPTRSTTFYLSVAPAEDRQS